MITCEIIVEEIAPGRLQCAVIPKVEKLTPLEEKTFLPVQDFVFAHFRELFSTAKDAGSIEGPAGNAVLEPAIRARMQALRREGEAS